MNKRPAFTHSFSLNDSTTAAAVDQDRDCLLDLLDIKFSDTHLYSATRFSLSDYEEEGEEDLDRGGEGGGGGSDESDLVKFIKFGFRQHSQSILKQQSDIFFRIERNLDNELSHKSPDFYIHSKFSEVKKKNFINFRFIILKIVYYS